MSNVRQIGWEVLRQATRKLGNLETGGGSQEVDCITIYHDTQAKFATDRAVFLSVEPASQVGKCFYHKHCVFKIICNNL